MLPETIDKFIAIFWKDMLRRRCKLVKPFVCCRMNVFLGVKETKYKDLNLQTHTSNSTPTRHLSVIMISSTDN